MFCPRCGNNNENTARFCFSCGQRFSQATQPAGPSGPEWSQFQDPVPQPAPPPAPPPPPQPVYTPPPNQMAPAPVKKATNPALAVAVIAGITIVLAGAFFLTRDDDSGGDVCCAPRPEDLTPRSGSTSLGTPGPNVATPAPVVGPGYKLTAIFVTPPGATSQPSIDKRLYDAMVAGVWWEGAAQLYGRRYPLQFVFNNATTNLLLQRHNPEEARKQLRDAGFTSQGPKMMLAFNPGDRVFAVWLIEQMRGLGYTVVTDANNFSAEEKAKGYYGLILDVVP